MMSELQKSIVLSVFFSGISLPNSYIIIQYVSFICFLFILQPFFISLICKFIFLVNFLSFILFCPSSINLSIIHPSIYSSMSLSTLHDIIVFIVYSFIHSHFTVHPLFLQRNSTLQPIFYSYPNRSPSGYHRWWIHRINVKIWNCNGRSRYK